MPKHIKPDAMLPIASKPDRSIATFYYDAAMSMALTQVLTEQEALALISKIDEWVKKDGRA